MAPMEGTADMALLPRLSKISLGTLVLLALISLPTFRHARTQGSALAPSIAWAGGSPDETLKPPDGPAPTTPPNKSASIRIGSTTYADVGTVGTRRSFTRLTALQRWEILVSVFRTFATRF